MASTPLNATFPPPVFFRDAKDRLIYKMHKTNIPEEFFEEMRKWNEEDCECLENMYKKAYPKEEQK